MAFLRSTWNLAAFIVCFGSGLVQAEPPAPRSISDVVPADVQIVYMARPIEALGGSNATTQPTGAVNLATILSLLNSSGLIPDEGQVFADIATALPLLGRYEHALVLLDVSSKVVRRPGRPGDEGPRVSLRLKHMQSAVIFRTEGDDRTVLQHLNRIIGRYTNNAVAELTTEKAVGFEYQRLVDERMPGWAIWEWGRLGDFFAVCFGAGSFEKLAMAYSDGKKSISSDNWFRNARERTKGDQALAMWYIAFERMELRLNEVARGRHEAVTAALGADQLTQDFWTIGLDDRAISCYRLYRRKGEDVMHRYSDPAGFPKNLREIIPKDSRHYAVINVPTRWLVDNVPRAWLAAQSQRHLEEWTRIWESLEKEVGVDLSASLINHLGDHVLLFDYPPHPLDLPLVYTLAISVDDERAVKLAIDAILAAWAQYLDDRAKRGDNSLFRVRVHKDPDDVWFIQAGILGPALKVIDGYIVISWSPQALRDALKAMGKTKP